VKDKQSQLLSTGKMIARNSCLKELSSCKVQHHTHYHTLLIYTVKDHGLLLIPFSSCPTFLLLSWESLMVMFSELVSFLQFSKQSKHKFNLLVVMNLKEQTVKS